VVGTKAKPIDYYIRKIEAHLAKKYPELEFEVVKRSDREAIIWYRPYSEEDSYPIIKRAGNLLTDAIIDGFTIHLMPA
jgi:hypothetical protein